MRGIPPTMLLILTQMLNKHELLGYVAMRLNATIFIPRLRMLRFLRCLQLFRLLDIPTMDLFLITVPSPNLPRP